MSTLTQAEKTSIIEEYQRDDADTGSPQVQIAVLTQRIKGLTEHLKANRHDHSSRRGLLQMVSTRSRLLKYLQRVDRPGYLQLIGRLGLRK